MITGNNSDNLTVACMALDIFTKTWCMDCEFTENHDYLIFRCDECEFCKDNGECLIEHFVINHTGDLPEDFVTMSR